MKPFPRILGLFLSLTLALPNSALALREQPIADKRPAVLAGLGEALEGNPGPLLRLASAALPPATASPIFAPATRHPEFPLAAAGLEESPATGFELNPLPDQAAIEINRRYLESKGWADQLSGLPYDRPFILEDEKLQITLD